MVLCVVVDDAVDSPCDVPLDVVLSSVLCVVVSVELSDLVTLPEVVLSVLPEPSSD